MSTATYTPGEDAVELAATRTRAIAYDNYEDLVERIAELKEGMTAISERRKTLLSVEQHTSNELSKHFNNLRAESDRTQQAVSAIEFGQTTGYPCLSAEVFGWRTPNGAPVLVPFHVDNASVTLTWDQWGQMNIGPDKVRWMIGDLWKDVKRPGVKTRANTTMTATFTGVIPETVRGTIRNHAKDPVFLLTEVSEWDVRHTAIPVHTDPLVVVHKYGRLWLIDKFDTTPVEEYIAREFVS